MTLHQRGKVTDRDCAWCGAAAEPASGVYLARLYPGSSFCRPCGRRSLFCTCKRGRAE